jgi:hypothetical protein
MRLSIDGCPGGGEHPRAVRSNHRSLAQERLMRPLCLLSIGLVSSLAAQNEILYYKFEGGGTKALNYAAGSPAPGQGAITNTLTTSPTGSYVPGRFGSALSASISPTTAPYQANYVDTGWAPNVTGNYTWAMWMRNSRGTAGPSLTYIAGIPVSGMFRIYSGASILLTVGGAGGTTYYSTVANVYQLATAGWVHVAFVVDTTALTATYYINGVAEAPRVLTAAPNIIGNDFYIGVQYVNSYPSIYDVDEFRFLTRAATQAEITQWSTVNTAGSSVFGQGCGATLAPSGGLPQLGNYTYGFTAAGLPNAVGFTTLGFSRNHFGPVTLPADLGSYVAGMGGCFWECSSEATLLTTLDPAGSATTALPILPQAQYDGLEIFAQSIFIGGPRGMMSTNPVCASIGN